MQQFAQIFSLAQREVNFTVFTDNTVSMKAFPTHYKAGVRLLH